MPVVFPPLPFRQPSGRPHPSAAGLEEVGDLAAALRRQLRGEVRLDSQSRALYSTDASNYRQVPIGVVVPRDLDDVVATVAICHQFSAPVLARGGGTSLAGQCCNVAVVVDFSKYVNHVHQVDRDGRFAFVDGGTILDDLRHAAEGMQLTFGPDPATHSRNTLGGMLGNNSCGVHSVMAAFDGPGARTSDNVRKLNILTYDGLQLHVGPTSEDEIEAIVRSGGRRGEIYGRLRALRDRYAPLIRKRFPDIPRRVSGYNLPELLPERGFNVARALVGSESTCVMILGAQLSLIANPGARALVVLGYHDVYDAAAHVPDILQYRPIGLEGLDDVLVRFMKRKRLHPADIELLPEGGGWLMVEFGGADLAEAESRARGMMDALKKRSDTPSMKLFDSPDETRKMWEVRESGLGATAFVPGEPDSWPGWEDSAVPVDKLADYLHDLRGLFHKYDIDTSLYGHFGQGCVHCRIPFDVVTRQGLDHYRSFVEEATDRVVHYGGSISGEHGDGQARAELLPRMFGQELMEAFREFKQIWDPDGRMNPGKLIDAYRLDENLRLGTSYEPREPATHFSFPDDHQSFSRAALRCVGVGKCRQLGGETMCPSFQVTREEKDSTRGRARLLFEMLRGEVIADGWQSEEVKDSLDLCLACKGCKGDCPLNVDMATYKAEFLSHYYERHARPRQAWAFGLIHEWSRLAAIAPGLINAVAATPPLAALARSVAGMPPGRDIPRFAPRTFRSWFEARPVVNPQAPPVLVWPDTFNNHFHPGTLAAAVEVLEHAGRRVVIPSDDLCCGRPLYDYGLLERAKSQLRQILDSLRPAIRDGVPMVGLEPSCTAVFRDEMVSMTPHDEDALRLRTQTHTLGEFLKREGYETPPLPRRAMVHRHCHHNAVMGFTDDEQVLSRLKLDLRVLDSGCCGMAGSFGFEKDHYDVSIAVGERVLLPAVREAPRDTIVVADGFSCREQIRQQTPRRALHEAEVLQLALHAGDTDARDLPERASARLRPRSLVRPEWRSAAIAGVLAGILMGAAWIGWRQVAAMGD